MKFRTNAQKKRIDAWLIYRCDGCSETWNLPILERAAIGDIPSSQFQALARNDRALAMRHAFDWQRLARHSDHVEDSSEITVEKAVPNGCSRDAAIIEISLVLAVPCQWRLDRFLARELGLTRSRLATLHEDGVLRVAPARQAMRSPLADGQSITIDLHGEAIHLDLVAVIRRKALD